MYLSEIKIKNFRIIQQADCQFNPGLNLIVGANDSGKTAVIDAIRLLLKQIVDDYFRLSPDDFYDQNLEITLDATFSFSDCVDETQLIKEAALFSEYLSFNSDNQPKLNIWYSIKSNEKDIKFPSFKVGPSKDVAVDMDARCRENLKVVYLRPLRNAEIELRAKQGSRISKILNNHDNITNAKDELIGLLETFKNNSEGFFETGKGKDIAVEINRLLELFDEQSTSQKKEIKFGPTEKLDHLKTLEKIALYYPNLLYPGLGTLNMIFIAAELLHLSTQKTPKLILVEEIEAHLHPQRQLKIIKALQDEAKKGIQMILTTHSSNLASIIQVERLNICHEGRIYSLAKGKTELSDNNYAYLARFLDVTKTNLFFARGVILVEGPTEQLLIPEFAKILGYNVADYGISVVSINNLGFENFVNIFKRKDNLSNKIPIAVITDADKRGASKIDKYIKQIENKDNSIGCFVSKQLSSHIDISKNRGTTFEKIILKETTNLKKLYIDTYNTFKKRKSARLKAEDTLNFLYSRIEKIKAPIAQEVAKQLSEISEEEKSAYKKEIEDHLRYIDLPPKKWT